MKFIRTLLLLLLPTILATAQASDIVIKQRPVTDPLPLAKQIDKMILARLLEEKVPASPLANDAEFLRRASIDITGDIPSAEEATAFLANTTVDKRRVLIDKLLQQKAYGDNFGSIWNDFLIVPNADNRFFVSPAFETWLAEQFNAGRGWDKIVYDILTAEGARDDNPATTFWLTQVEQVKRNFHVKPAEAVGRVTQRMMGIQYQCAECHDHPFTPLTQNEFWGIAAFFGHVELEGANRGAAKSDNFNPAVHEKVALKTTIDVPEADNYTVAARLPGGSEYKASGEKMRSVFAKWFVAPGNAQFARAAVNRVWAHFFARGIVHPADDFRSNNLPSHPEILDSLAESFVASGYDLRHLVRCICNSQAYQRSSDAQPGNAKDDELFSHMYLKAMTPYVLKNAVETALEKEPGNNNKRKRKMPKKPGKRDPFSNAFATSDEPDDPDYSHGVPQVLQLMNGDFLDNAPVVQHLSRSKTETAKAIDELFLTALTRVPTAAERTRMAGLVSAAQNPEKGYSDVLWVLLNSSEFILNH